MSTKKILIVAGDAVEALEVYYPYFRCLEEGYETDIAAPTKKVLHTVVHDFEDWETYTEKRGYQIEATKAFEEIDASQYDAIIIPGGRAPEHIRMDEHLPGIIKHFFEADKPIAVVCHGSLALTMIEDAVKGRELTAYIACKPEVESIGATYINKMNHTDNNLISAHSWPDLSSLMKEFIKQVNALEKVKD
ncbi:DJ-1/PfpI family protein [Lentibacillus salinarum]|uniref:DJ-1/PfpI family protein n=1 Tax=Lentibacillus salinarum TaxID=446820 RepID=A0ABW3ZY16_9BACI